MRHFTPQIFNRLVVWIMNKENFPSTHVTHKTTMTIPQEHQSLILEFGLISNNNNNNNGKASQGTNNITSKSTNFSYNNETIMSRPSFAIPAVTLRTKGSNRYAKKSQSQQQQSWCSMGRIIRWALAGFAFFYAKQLSRAVKLLPQTILSNNTIKGDYSYIGGIQDLQTSHIRPICFVSSCP